MGAGQGKSRRTQARAISGDNAWAQVDIDRWYELIRQPGVKGFNLTRYYRTKLRADETELIARNIYADLVSLDAIQFPAGVDADDFEIEVGIRLIPYGSPWPQGDGRKETSLVVRRKSTGEERIALTQPKSYLHTGNRVTGRKVNEFVEKLLTAFTHQST